ncbi:MAG: hypothetical protein JJU45_04705 [Acidimicrobiia bacterium]|nr:hypothetical protein [Acidimicrobiia bacterium]
MLGSKLSRCLPSRLEVDPLLDHHCQVEELGTVHLDREVPQVLDEQGAVLTLPNAASLAPIKILERLSFAGFVPAPAAVLSVSREGANVLKRWLTFRADDL